MSVYGPVWASLPQTSQAGEHAGLAGLLDLVHHHKHEVDKVHIDCKSVADLGSSPYWKQLRPSAKYAGMRRTSHVKQQVHPDLQYLWTKAHRTKEELAVLSGPEKAIADANNIADELAKRGAGQHPDQLHDVQKQVEREVSIATFVLKLAARVLPMFTHDRFPRQCAYAVESRDGGPDPVDPDPVPRLEPAPVALEGDALAEQPPHGGLELEHRLGHDSVECPRDSFSDLQDGHRWSARGCCLDCLISRTRWLELQRPACEGRCKDVILHNRFMRHGHYFQRVDSEDDSCLICMICGGWGSVRFSSLRKVCLGRPTAESAQSDALARVSKGRHPSAKKGRARLIYRSGVP